MPADPYSVVNMIRETYLTNDNLLNNKIFTSMMNQIFIRTPIIVRQNGNGHDSDLRIISSHTKLTCLFQSYDKSQVLREKYPLKAFLFYDTCEVYDIIFFMLTTALPLIIYSGYLCSKQHLNIKSRWIKIVLLKCISSIVRDVASRLFLHPLRLISCRFILQDVCPISWSWESTLPKSVGY